ncbi:MAG TPA: class I SAM-dependent methyltransferase [Bacteroidales bacterium]|nr:class I SAM-dependent methyltransferase [Bacteroidales bacterium]HOK99772.1 class I SAM-dependent methyltransferase [Bacteroidales bacterium]HPO66542.1 class I SAM-dependent methyltransferase [Bacteroidales bacterium]
MPYRKVIANAYDAGVEEEYNRLTESPLREAEFQLIIELLDEYIPNGATVIDIGSGPGRYAEYLLKRSCKVGVVDLSPKSLKVFSDRMENSYCKQNIIFNQVSCATQLDWIADNLADAILLMGPLYHLIDAKHRNKALNHCKRILKTGGYLFSVFLSPFPLLNNANTFQEGSYLFSNEDLYKHIKSDITTHTHFQGFDVPQYRYWPKVAKELMLANGFETLRIRNIEGIGSFYNSEKLKDYSNQQQKLSLINILRSTSEDEKLIGITHQFVCVGKSV